MKQKGLTSTEVEESRKKYGSNKLTQLANESFLLIFLRGFTDPMILILLVALAVQLILCFVGEAKWYEPAGVLVAIMIANIVSSVSQYRQEKKALALKSEEEAKETAKVFRDGKLCELHVSEVVVGDILFIQAGDKLAADGEVVEGSIWVDQSALNGETEEAEKRPVGQDEKYDTKDLLNPSYAYRGTVACGGEGCVEVKTVGDKTMFGELALEVQTDRRTTPLQLKLGKLAKQISVFGYIGAALIVAAILLITIITGNAPDEAAEWASLIVRACTIAITIIVCAVPEGLPMLTSVLLSLQSVKMAKDNVLVKNINGIETAGSLSILFTDKTGTITEGKLSVTEITTGNVHSFTSVKDMPELLREELVTGIGVNNSANASEGNIIGGNSTDRALMSYLVSENSVDKLALKNVKAVNAFDSEKKLSSVTINDNGKDVTYVKGAPEKIIAACTKYIDENGQIKDFSDNNMLSAYITMQAARSMRLLAVARADGNSAEADLTLIGVVCIRDNVRKEAADAIREVRAAGIQVVMITGDRKETAVAIAKDAGLLASDDDIALTSSELADMSDDDIKKLLPRLRVVARALPLDKSRLVRIAQELDMVVGMTGDGVNDSPALKKADVGFAMGSGTEVAKSAGDITIMDDNFLSIEKAILYGRSMFKTIRKFLIFQLTVNVAAVLTCLIGAILGENMMLTVIQLLMINLAMDTLAAIAFGSEPANKEYMKDKPVPRKAGIITKQMIVRILIASLYITGVCLAIRFLPDIMYMFVSNSRDIEGGIDTVYLRSALFATFIMAITFNGFNARTEKINLFDGLGKNIVFLAVMLCIFVLQFVFVTFGGEVLSVEALSPKSWLICAAFAIMVIPIDLLRKLLVRAFSKNKE